MTTTPKRHRWRTTALAALLALLPASLATLPASLAWAEEPTTAALPSTSTSAVAIFTKVAPEGVNDLRSMEGRVKELVAQLTPATVAVRVGGAMGSGVIINGGYVLTAGHVSGTPGQRALVILHDGKRLQAETLGRNRMMDSGLIKITEEGEWPTVELGKASTLQRGEWCLTLGHPGGYQHGRPPVVRLGRVVRYDRGAIRTDCTLVGGDSGGPLFDMNGRLIGIHSRIAASLTANFHVPIDTYVESFDRLAKGDDFGHGEQPVIGVRGEDHGQGCRLMEVFPKLPAAEAGLREGDIITRLGDVQVKSLLDLVAAVNNHEPGDEVTVEFIRGTERLVRKATLVERPAEERPRGDK